MVCITFSLSASLVKRNDTMLTLSGGIFPKNQALAKLVYVISSESLSFFSDYFYYCTFTMDFYLFVKVEGGVPRFGIVEFYGYSFWEVEIIDISFCYFTWIKTYYKLWSVTPNDIYTAVLPSRNLVSAFPMTTAYVCITPGIDFSCCTYL